MWIGGSGGLSRFVDGRVVTVNHENGLPGNRVWAIVDDDDGDLWLSVDRGLVHVSRDEFAAAAAARRTAPVQAVRHVGRSRRRAARQHPCGASGRRQAVVRPRRRAHAWWSRERCDGDRPLASAPLRIEAAVANERRFSAAPQTSLPPGTRRLQINYTALTLTASNKIRFRYRLDGFDTDWVDAGTRRVGVLHQPLAAQLPVPASRPIPTTARWNTATRDVGLRHPAGVLSDQLVLCVVRGDGRRSSCGARGGAGCGSSGGSSRWCWPSGRD